MAQINSYLQNPASTFTLATGILNLNDGSILAGTTKDIGVPTSIIINWATYATSNQMTNSLTVLHELAHLLGLIPTDGTPTSSKNNDQTVIDECGKTIGFSGKLP
jgi:hypothetical protein